MIDLSSRRLVVAYNPASSRAPEVDAKVFKRLDEEAIKFTKIEVAVATPEQNMRSIASQIKPGDVILSAAGDGSAHAVMNGVLAANQPGVSLGFLAFGNFNDLPRSLNSRFSLQDPLRLLENGRPETVYPLHIKSDSIDRASLLYITMGWTAAAAGQYDRPEVRGRLQKPGQAFMINNLIRLTKYYFRSRKDYHLPLQDNSKVTDILAVNGSRTARFFKSRHSLTSRRDFLTVRLDVSSLIKNLPFLVLSVVGFMPAKPTAKLNVKFKPGAKFLIQLDGEVLELNDPTGLVIAKSDQPLEVLTTKFKI